MVLAPEVAQRVRRLALQNAAEHQGVPNPGPILARLLSTDAALRSQSTELGVLVRSIVAEVARLSPDVQSETLLALGGPESAPSRTPARAPGELPPLPGAEHGKVVLRMAPFPSGGLHIGSARMIFVNDYYRRRYDGKLLLVFDDTVGSEEKRVDPELFDVIRHDLEVAGAPPDAVYYKSDRIPLFYPWARRVIEKGGAYVCRCPAELLRENRAKGLACPERPQTEAETLAEWERMLGGAYGPGEAVLRLRTDLSDPDPAFRDRVLFRISDLDHPRVGRRYRVWPLLEFSWAVDDIELGTTHVIRGKDLVMEDRMQQYIWSLLGVRGPPFLHWGLLRLREAKISKSKSYAEVKSGEYDGWSDPRTWSIGSLDRRGISAEAIRRFTLSFGLSLADIEVPAETLYAENRGLIDATTPRRSFVADPVRVDVEGYPPDLRTVSMSNHPDVAALGRRDVVAGPSFWIASSDAARHAGQEVRLKELVNIQLPDGEITPGTTVRALFTSKENKKLPRIQWVGAAAAVPVDLLGVEGEHRHGIGEHALASSPPRSIYQFERVGFVRIDAGWEPGQEPIRVVFGHP
jgi:glutamyl-tRNA synthetase